MMISLATTTAVIPGREAAGRNEPGISPRVRPRVFPLSRGSGFMSPLRGSCPGMTNETISIEMTNAKRIDD